MRCVSQLGDNASPDLYSRSGAARSTPRVANRTCLIALAAAVLASVSGAGTANAQSSDSDLAKQLANPIASLISVPFQNNFDCCYGPNGIVRHTLNIQPVIPFKLNEDWNLITRTILPVISQGSIAPGWALTEAIAN